MRLIPYLMFNGQCRQAFEFYRDALAGTLEDFVTYGESPMCDQIPADGHDRIMHASLLVGEVRLMGADGPPVAGGNRNHVNADVDSIEEAERVWVALSDGAEIQMPLQETFWAHRWGMLVDRFGQPWMVNFLKPCPED